MGLDPLPDSASIGCHDAILTGIAGGGHPSSSGLGSLGEDMHVVWKFQSK